MQPHAKMERVLATCLHQVLVGADTSRLESLRRNLLVLAADQVDAEWEFVHAGLLAAEIEDADLRVRHTAAEARLRIRLVLAVPVAAGALIWLEQQVSHAIKTYQRAGRRPMVGWLTLNHQSSAVHCGTENVVSGGVTTNFLA